MIALQPGQLVLTIVAGESRSRERRLAWGVAAPPLSLGATAEWQVRGAGIADVHVQLSFDGRRLRAAVAAPAALARVHDAELGADWRELELPFELAFGSARISGHVIGAASVGGSAGARRGVQPASEATCDAALEGRRETGFLDLQTINQAALIPRATLSVGVLPLPLATLPSLSSLPSSEQAEAERRGYSRTLPASAFQIASGSTLSWSLGSLHVPPPRPVPDSPSAPRARATRTVSASLRTSLDTLCDGGALRQYAQTLEPRVAREPRSPAPISKGRAHARAARALVVALERVWRRGGNRLASVPKGRWAAVPAAAAAAVLLTGWALSSPAALENRSADAPMDPPAARGQAGSSGGAAPTPTDESEQSSAARVPPATDEPSPGRIPRVPAPPAAPSFATSAPATASFGATPPATPPPATPPPATPPPARAPLGATPPGTPRPGSVGSAPAPGGALELEAFRAAFGGDTARAETLYRELARLRNAPLFQHAARALRDNRVHKP
jgi:hypothetical protein